MASSSSIPQNKFDVFLSFRGEDTRYNFTSHLYAALCRKQISTFIDDELPRGDEISPSLLDAIEGSSISVVIFSEGYASSRWCLDELVTILECKNKYGQIVIPVFYRVDPSDVRKQTGIFGDLFSKLEERFQERLDKLRTWRIALTEAANLSGFDSRVIRRESELVEKIANDILKRLKDKSESYCEYHLVGVETRIKEIETLLSTQLTDVYVLGIWGMGGIGKTTTARAIFHKISCNFQASCFIESVRGEGENKGSNYLRQRLFSTIYEDDKVKIGVLNDDLNFRRLSCMKVLIVFDDVTSLDEIKFLIQNLRNCAKGSRIIITSRDMHVLKNCRVDGKYEVKELLPDDALKLFSQHAFGKSRPNVGFKELTMKILEYASGVPLALKILGCFLLEMEKDAWESAIEKLKKIPNKDIQKVLKISYDGLDDEEKNIFLEIACFFNWQEKDLTKEFLDAWGCSAKIGIVVLVQKCLIVISDNTIIMHDLLQQMGREIARQESADYPEKRSRLCHHDDIYEVLRDNKGTEAIRGISFDMSKVEEMRLDPSTFTKIPNLRFLKFYGPNKCKLSHFHGPALRGVRYLHWQGYPLKSLPSRIHPEHLVALELRGSKVEKLWDGVQNLVKLKKIDLRNSMQLTKLPDLSRARNLEDLILVSCSSLVEIHSSIQHLNKLVVIDAYGCRRLKRLPPCIHSESLEQLCLLGCEILKRLPEISSCNLEHLCLSESSRLMQVPRSTCKLKSLEHLYLSDCSNLHRYPDELRNLAALKVLGGQRIAIKEVLPSILCLQSLKCLGLMDCSITELPESLGRLSSLEYLLLAKNNFERIPESIINLCQLKRLELNYCERLRHLPQLPCSLGELQTRNCTSLETLSGLSHLFAVLTGQRFDFRNCHKLDGNELREIVEDARDKIQRLTITYSETYQGNCDNASISDIFYPGSEIPEWFEFRSSGSVIALERPQCGLIINHIVGIVFCVIVAFEQDHHHSHEHYRSECELRCKLMVNTKDGQRDLGDLSLCGTIDKSTSDHVLLSYRLRGTDMFNDECHCNEIIFQFYASPHSIEKRMECCDVVKGCGIHFFYDREFGESLKDRTSLSIDEEEERHPKWLKYASSSFLKKKKNTRRIESP